MDADSDPLRYLYTSMLRAAAVVFVTTAIHIYLFRLALPILWLVQCLQ